MISASMLPLYSGAKSAYSSQMALFGAAQPASSTAGHGSLALADRIGNSTMLTKSDKSGLMRLMATVEKFGGSNKDVLMAKVSAAASMSEMLNSNQGVTIEPFNAANSLELYRKHQSEIASDAVRVSPESEIKALFAGLQAQLSD